MDCAKRGVRSVDGDEMSKRIYEKCAAVLWRITADLPVNVPDAMTVCIGRQIGTG